MFQVLDYQENGVRVFLYSAGKTLEERFPQDAEFIRYAGYDEYTTYDAARFFHPTLPNTLLPPYEMKIKF